MGLQGRSGAQLTPADWVQVVIVAGIGSVLEWLDFFSYSFLDGTIKKAFFPTSETLYWVCFGLAMAARPAGALIFGHIGDTAGRTRALMLGIILMAGSTALIGCLPIYDEGPYTAGWVAPTLLILLRILQGLAMGGEFGAAITYISEMAGVRWRCTFTSLLQATALFGMLLSLSLVMILQAFISSYNMLVWGWRIPFVLATFTAILGIWMRRGMPEPHAFLHAARAQKRVPSRRFSKRQRTLLGADAEWEAETQPAAEGAVGEPATADLEASKRIDGGKESPVGGSAAGEEGAAPEQEAEAEEPQSRVLSGKLHRMLSSPNQDSIPSKVPLLRILREHWATMAIQVAYTAWPGAMFYTVSNWLPSELRSPGAVMSVRVSQGILLASIVPGVLGFLAMGWALDRGWRAINLQVAVVVVNTALLFGVCYASWESEVGAWLVTPLIFFTGVGPSLTGIGAPCTRLYPPLERVSAYSFGYNVAMGIIGGFTPLICSSIMDSLPAGLKDYAGAFWMLGLAGLSLLGAALLHSLAPRLNKPFVGHIE